MIGLLTVLGPAIVPIVSFLFNILITNQKKREEALAAFKAYMKMDLDNGAKSLELRDSEQAQLDSFKSENK